MLICEYAIEKSLLHPEFAAQEMTNIIALRTWNIATFTGTFSQDVSKNVTSQSEPVTAICLEAFSTDLLGRESRLCFSEEYP